MEYLLQVLSRVTALIHRSVNWLLYYLKEFEKNSTMELKINYCIWALALILIFNFYKFKYDSKCNLC